MLGLKEEEVNERKGERSAKERRGEGGARRETEWAEKLQNRNELQMKRNENYPVINQKCCFGPKSQSL